MPGTPEEYVRFATAEEFPAATAWGDGTAITAEDRNDIVLLREHCHRLVRHKRRDLRPQRTAMRLLRSFLTAAQRAQLKRSGSFLVTTAAGNHYRLRPRTGHAAQVTRHGRHHYALRHFCLHDDPDDRGGRMPPADLSLAHMLLLLSDEDGFLRLANARTARDQLWNGGYLRRLRRARREAAGCPS